MVWTLQNTGFPSTVQSEQPLSLPTVRTQVQKVCDELYGKEADYVDWRHFLVCAAQPWPLPLTHQLLETRNRLRSENKISRQQFMATQTWMDEKAEEGGGFNRNEKLKQFFFKLFSDGDGKVDYTTMVGS